jgi:hypothetical protein
MLLIRLTLFFVLSISFLYGSENSLFAKVSGDGFLIQNKYALHRLLLLNEQSEFNSVFPISWRQNCTVLDSYLFFKSNPSYFSSCQQRKGIVTFSEIKTFQSYNSSYPAGFNDGSIWQGVGYNNAFSIGGQLNWGALRVSINPVFGFNQNKDYELHPYPKSNNQRYSYWLQRIDYVQLYGDGPVYWFDLGHSEINLSIGVLHTGFSTSPMLTGPGIQTSLLYSYNAPGLPRFFLASKNPVMTPIGHIGAHYFYGIQSKSDYFDQRTDNRLTSIHNLNLQFTPVFYKNLIVGFNRTFQETYPITVSELVEDIGKMFKFLGEGALTRQKRDSWSPDNQLFTFYLHWLFPEHNFELYVEWGRDDHSVNLDELFIQPDHSRAYLFGALKSIRISNDRILGLGFEMTQMDTPRNSLVRGSSANPFGLSLAPWGAHVGQTIGMTNKGQLLGNGYGLGANVRSLRLEYLNHVSFSRLSLNKIAHNPVLVDDPRYRTIIRNYNLTRETFTTRMTEFLVTFHHTRSILPGTEMGVGLDLSHTLHRYHIAGNNHSNVRIEFTVKQAIGK